MGFCQRPGPRFACAGLLAWVLGASAQAREPASAEILVRLRASGAHAVGDCAEALWRRGAPLAGASRDASDSLDRLHTELGVERVTALFRRTDGRPFAAQRAALRARWERPRRALPPRTRAALPAVPELAHVYRIALPPGRDPAAAAARYAADPHVLWAQPNFELALDRDVNDPFFSSSGSWGQPYGDLWGLHRVNAPAAWDLALGEGVVVAVIDSGIDTAHPDLADNLWVNTGEDLDGDGRAGPADRNGVDDDGNGYVDDVHGFDFANSIDANDDGDFDDPGDVSDADPFDDSGHGSHVAGTLAAVADNGIGIAGVAPRARIMAVKGFTPAGRATADVLARAMIYAIENGARVINNSWSCNPRCPSNPLIEEAVALAAATGVVVVTSAGNRADDVQFYSPENRRETIVVAASDEKDARASFSSLGYLVDLSAPGAADLFGPGVFPRRAILSTRSSGTPDEGDGGLFTIDGDYWRLAGTSMSAPHVAGVVALVLSARPDLTPDEVRGVLRRSARDLGAPGHDRDSGAGLADARAALETDPPAYAARFTDPVPGAIVVPREAPIPIRATLRGDVVAIELAVGAGFAPAGFEPIPLRSDFDGDGALADWNAAAADDGPYVLRLAVEGGDGGSLVEFLPLSLERNPPTRISSPGPAAHAPAISGRLVAWESQRPRDGAGADEPPDLDVFVRDWQGDEWRAVAAPGDQRGAQLSGRRLAWLDDGAFASEIRSCWLSGGRAPHCRDRLAAAGEADRRGLVVSGQRLVWSERGEDASLHLRGCAFQGSRCRELALPFGPSQTDAALDRTGLWWLDRSVFPFRLLRCLGSALESCVPQAVETQQLVLSFAASGSLLVWTNGAIVSPPLLVCRVEAEGRCARRRVAEIGLESNLAVSGRRVVWDAPSPAGDSDIFFCEHDPHTGDCPPQRLTGSAAEQRRPDVSGSRVVWEDDRDGEVAIYGIELPSLAPLADRRVRAGRPLSVGVRGHDPSGEGLALSAAFADGTPLEARGARFEDRGDGTGVLGWTPGTADIGEHLVRFEARGAGGLVSAHSIRIDVIEHSPAQRRLGAPLDDDPYAVARISVTR